MTTSTIRLVPAPVIDPPYDDEIEPAARTTHQPDAIPATQGTLALAFVLPSGLPAVPRAPLYLAPDPDDDPEFAPRHTPTSALPPPRRWAAQFIQGLLEVVAGDRPAPQLLRWTTPAVYEQIRQASGAMSKSGMAARGARPVGWSHRALVRSLHIGEPSDGAAEVCATVQRGPRAAAIALRLDGVDGRWQCTALQWG